MFTIATVQEPVQEMATVMVREEQNRVLDALRLISNTRTARTWYAPTAGQQQRLFGVAIRMATPSATLAGSTSNYTMCTDQ